MEIKKIDRSSKGRTQGFDPWNGGFDSLSIK